jgi:conserved oligomeric Golgi complex subunit 5
MVGIMSPSTPVKPSTELSTTPENSGISPPAQDLSVRGSTLLDVIAALSADHATSPFLDADITPQEHVGSAVREKRVSEALRDARRAAETLSAHVRDEVVHRKEALLAEVDAVAALEKEVATVSSGVSALASASTALADALAGPYVPMTDAVRTLKNVRDASSMLAAVSRFRFCTLKLADASLFPAFSAADKTLPEHLPAAAEAVSELEDMVSHGSANFAGLEKVEMVSKNLQAVRRAGLELRRRASTMLKSGIASKEQLSVSAAVSAFHALGVLPERINGEVGRLLTEIQAAIQRGLDPPRSGSGLSLSTAFSGIGVTANIRDPWNATGLGDKRFSGDVNDTRGLQGTASENEATARGQSAETWDRLDDMLETIRDLCSKAVLLQQVLSNKYDDVSHLSLLHEPIASAFIDAVGKSFGEQILALARTHRQRAGAGKAFRAMISDYPRLRSMLISMSGRIHTLVRGSSHPISLIDQNGRLPIVPDRSFIETTFLAAARDVETHYLTSSLERLTSTVTDLFEADHVGGPGSAETLGLVRVLASELSAARNAPDLFQTSVVNIATALRLYRSHVEDFAAANAPDAEEGTNRMSNVRDWHLVRCYNGLITMTKAARRVLGSEEDGSGYLPQHIAKEVDAMCQFADMLLDGPFAVCSSHITRTLQRIHTEDLTSSRGIEDGCSLYAVDVGLQLSMFSDGIIQNVARSRTLGMMTEKLGRHVLDMFVRHAMLVFPLSEGGRHRLATDMARIEHAVDSICPVQSLGESYMAIRSLRKLFIFRDDELITATPSLIETLVYLRPSHVAYHLFSRCNDNKFVHPHRRDNMTPREFSDWLDAHSEDEAWAEVLKSVRNYEASLPSSSQTPTSAQYRAVNALAIPLRDHWLETARQKQW